MAKLYGEIAAKALLTLDKSFARANGQPLDASEVYYSLQAAKDYAATAQAYIGQKIVVIENGVVSHYSVEDTAGNLKELGSKPVADGTTVAIGADGKITLANIAEANKTGTYNAVLVNGTLTWVKPSETTVEGLSDLIQALTGRVDAAEADIDALQAAVGVAAKEAVGEEGAEGYEPAVAATGLHKAIADEKVRAEAAEKALSDKIDAIDYIDETELATALEPYAKNADVVDSSTYATDKKALEDGIAAKVDSTTYAADKKALEDEDAAIRAIAEGARDSLNAFLTSEEVDETVNTLKEIQAEIEKMTDATELATALSSKADKTYVDEELGKKQDVIPENTYDAYGAAATAKSEAIADAEGKIATAKQEAIDAAATAAAGLYATQTQVSGLETTLGGRLDVLEAIDHTAYTTNAVFNEYKTTVENTYATQTVVNEISTVANNAAAKAETLEGKIDEITSVGGEPNTINYVQVNGQTLTPVEKTVNIIVPTKASDLTDDTGFDARITAAQNQADKGVNDAAAAATAAAQAQSEVDALETEVGGIQTVIAGHTTSISDHSTRIIALEQADITHATEYSTLSGIVSGHTGQIAAKADQTALDAAIADISKNATAIQTLNETTIVSINEEIAKKANSESVYTKTEINNITGEIAEGKTIVQMIEDAQSNATYDDTAIKALITAEENRAKGIESGLDSRLASVETFFAAVETPDEVINTLAEIVSYIESDKSGAADMAASIKANDDAIAAINHESTGILATAKKYTDDQIAAIPAATAETLGLVKVDNVSIQAENGVISVKAISTDLLVNGEEELILNGGSAAAQS